MNDKIKSLLIDFLAKKIFGGVLTGVKGIIFKFVVSKVFEYVLIPSVNFLIRKGLFVYDKEKGRIKLKNIEEAKKSNDESSYNSNIDDI